LKTFFFLS